MPVAKEKYESELVQFVDETSSMSSMIDKHLYDKMIMIIKYAARLFAL